MIVGADPGVAGAIAVITDGPFVRSLHRLTLPCDGLLRFLDDPRGIIKLVVVETQMPMPRQGRTSIGKQMAGFGRMLGTCEGLGLPTLTILPAVWKRKAGLLARGELDRVAADRTVADRTVADRTVADRTVADRKALILPHAHAVPNFTACLPRRCSKELEIACADAVCLALAAVQGRSGFEAYRWRF
jgi:hypothetical protein